MDLIKYHIITGLQVTASEEIIMTKLDELNWVYVEDIAEADFLIIGDSIKAKIELIGKIKKETEHFINADNYIARKLFT